MKNNFKTGQENFWAGNFGDEYINRNFDAKIIAGNINLFSKILRNTQHVNSVIEYGPNVGLNLIALKSLLPDAKLNGVEINEKAVKILKENKDVKVYHKSILEFKSSSRWDFVLVKGVLIHINPDELKKVYELLYKTSKKYICIVEYYNPKPVALDYRGHKDRLFKRDFAGEMLSEYKDLKLVDYGFSYHLDNNFPQDDLNWFLLEKSEK